MTQRDDFVNIALAQVGVLQYEWGDRCGWRDGTTDCSGLVSGSSQRVGCSVGPGCPNSSALARLGHDAPRPAWMLRLFGPDPYSGSTTKGTGITRAQALRTRGALGIKGDDEGRDGDGNKGHIKISLGDGRSVEASSHALDLRVWTFDDPRLSYFMLIPGMTGFDTDPSGNPDPSSAWEAETMGMVAITVPGAHPQKQGPAKGRTPLVAAISSDGVVWRVVGFNGAQLPGAKNTNGLSVLNLGKLNKPIESVNVVYMPDPDDPNPDADKRHLIPTRQVVFSAGDGGTFGPYRPEVRYA